MADIKVRAKTLGQLPDGTFVQPGEEFEIAADQASHRWMERVDGKPWPKAKDDPADRRDAETTALASELGEAKKREADLRAENDGLRQQVNDLQGQVSDLTARNGSLEQEVAAGKQKPAETPEPDMDDPLKAGAKANKPKG